MAGFRRFERFALCKDWEGVTCMVFALVSQQNASLALKLLSLTRCKHPQDGGPLS